MASDFGKDIRCTDSLLTGRYATGVRLVAEAAYRRLMTPRGTLRGGEEEQNYGIDLSDMVGKAGSESEAAAIPGRIATELKKDERIDSVSVDVLRTVNGPDVSLSITVAAQTAEGPFTLTLAASAVTVELLGGIEAAA